MDCSWGEFRGGQGWGSAGGAGPVRGRRCVHRTPSPSRWAGYRALSCARPAGAATLSPQRSGHGLLTRVPRCRTLTPPKAIEKIAKPVLKPSPGRVPQRTGPTSSSARRAPPAGAARRSVMTLPLWNDRGRSTDERVEALLAALTLEEKIAQLGSYWKRPTLGDAEGFAPMQSTFEEGSAPLEPEEGVENLRTMQQAVVDGSEHGIPALVHEECLTGVMAHGATTYPAAIAWGASFDPELIAEMAARIGGDMHAMGAHMG